MKNNVLLFALCFFAVNISLAQQGRTISCPDTDADKFIGTWKYESETYSISITFTKERDEIFGMDMTFGTYRVRRGGRIFEDLSGKGIMGMTSPDGSNPNQLRLTLSDVETHVLLSRFTLTMLDGYTDRAILNITEPPPPRANRPLPARQRQPPCERVLELERSLTGVSPQGPSREERQRNRPTASQILQDGIVLVKQ